MRHLKVGGPCSKGAPQKQAIDEALQFSNM